MTNFLRNLCPARDVTATKMRRRRLSDKTLQATDQQMRMFLNIPVQPFPSIHYLFAHALSSKPINLCFGSQVYAHSPHPSCFQNFAFELSAAVPFAKLLQSHL